jgi:hypothetical protein
MRLTREETWSKIWASPPTHKASARQGGKNDIETGDKFKEKNMQNATQNVRTAYFRRIE